MTVVIIFLNPGRYLAEAVDSVLAQTFGDYELILVDDGSTDESPDVARRYAAAHPDRIRYAQHPGGRNMGMSASRNLGVSLGRGRLISFLDADDIWLPTRLERFVAAIEAQPQAGMIYGPTLYWYSWAKGLEEGLTVPNVDDFPGRLDMPVGELIAAPEALRRFLETGGGCLPGMNSLIVRREAFDAVGGFEPEFRGLYEDQVFLSKMTASHPIAVIDEVLDHYRQHNASCCNRAIETGEYDPVDLHPARAVYLRWLRDYCRRIGLTDARLSKALHRELWPYESRLGFAVHWVRKVAPGKALAAARRATPPIARRAFRWAKWRLYEIRTRLSGRRRA